MTHTFEGLGKNKAGLRYIYLMDKAADDLQDEYYQENEEHNKE